MFLSCNNSRFRPRIPRGLSVKHICALTSCNLQPPTPSQAAKSFQAFMQKRKKEKRNELYVIFWTWCINSIAHALRGITAMENWGLLNLERQFIIACAPCWSL